MTGYNTAIRRRRRPRIRADRRRRSIYPARVDSASSRALACTAQITARPPTINRNRAAFKCPVSLYPRIHRDITIWLFTRRLRWRTLAHNVHPGQACIGLTSIGSQTSRIPVSTLGITKWPVSTRADCLVKLQLIALTSRLGTLTSKIRTNL